MEKFIEAYSIYLIMIVPIIYLFKLHKYVLVGRPLGYLFGLFALVGALKLSWMSKSSLEAGDYVIFWSPFVHWLAFCFAYWLFRVRVGREPIDVYYNFNSGLILDRIFAFFVFGFMPFSMFLVALI